VPACCSLAATCCLLAGSSLGSNPAGISQKYQMGDISQGVANTPARQKNIQKNLNSAVLIKIYWLFFTAVEQANSMYFNTCYNFFLLDFETFIF
jgi:hypothetical protein